MTLNALASETGCCQASVCKMEKGKVLPSLSTLFHLARALDVPPDAMLASTPVPSGRD